MGEELETVDFTEYNKPPFLPGWLSNGQTKELAGTIDGALGDVNEGAIELANQYDLEIVKNNPALLNRRGELLGLPRNGMDDKTYFQMQQLRIKLNLNKSTVNDIIELIKMFYESEEVHIIQNYPAGIRILHDGNGGKGVDFNSFMRETVGAGISFDTREIYRFRDGVDAGDKGGEVTVKYYGGVYYDALYKYNGLTTYKGYNSYNGEFKYNHKISYSVKKAFVSSETYEF